MGDDITIGVTEVVNNIEVTAQPNDQIIDIDVIDNSDSVTLNVTPNIIEVNVERGSSFARWGTIYGSILDQTDLQNALFNKADLVNGLVPAYQLPSFVDDVIEVANFASLPTTGETGKLYLTLDNNKIYRWGGSTYVEIASNQAIWGQITGTLSNQTDLQNALNAKQNLLNGTGFVRMSGTSVSYISGLESQFVKADGSLDNTSYLPLSGGTMTGNLFLRANNDVGGTNYFIGQTMATSDNWKIYGNTIANDRGELVFELGDNAQASSGVGQRFRFHYNEPAGTSKTVLTLDFNESTFNTNVNISGNLGVANGNPSNFQSFANQLVIGNGTTDIGMTIFSGSSNSGALYFADSTIGDDRRSGSIVYNHNSNIMSFDTNAVTRMRINESGKVAINAGTWSFNDGGLFNISNSGQHGFEFQPNHSLGRNAIFSYNRTTLSYNTILYSALDHIFAGNGTERMRITSGGNVGIGTTPLWSLSNNLSLEIGSSQLLWSPTNGAANCGMANNLYRNSTNWIHKNTGGGGLIAMEGGEVAIYLSTSSSAGSSADISEKFRIFQNANVRIQSLGTGLLYSNGGVLTSANPSDERLKDNIIDLEFGLNEILQLRPVSYNWKNDKINQGKQFGFIAQEVQEIMPELISEFTTTEDEEEVVRLGLDKEGIYATLVNAIKEQNEVLQQLKSEIELLKQK
jgi:hypothetical protein